MEPIPSAACMIKKLRLEILGESEYYYSGEKASVKWSPMHSDILTEHEYRWGPRQASSEKPPLAADETNTETYRQTLYRVQDLGTPRSKPDRIVDPRKAKPCKSTGPAQTWTQRDWDSMSRGLHGSAPNGILWLKVNTDTSPYLHNW